MAYQLVANVCNVYSSNLLLPQHQIVKQCSYFILPSLCAEHTTPSDSHLCTSVLYIIVVLSQMWDPNGIVLTALDIWLVVVEVMIIVA